MKICSKCQKARSLDKFSKHSRAKDGLKVWCKFCDKQYDLDNKDHRNVRKNKNSKNKRKELHDKLREYLKDKTCTTCSESDYVVMEFDHRDRSTKEFDISDGIGKRYSWKKILKELEKCDPMCANCHRRKTAKDMGWYK